MKNIKSILIVFLLSALVSCTSFRQEITNDDSLALIEDLNRGNSDHLIELSRLPFVYDNEILESDTQLRTLWSGLVKAGFMVDSPVILQQRPVQSSDAEFFSTSWEVKTYFKNLLSEKDSFVEVEGLRDKIFMVLRSGEKGSVLILAWKGVSK